MTPGMSQLLPPLVCGCHLPTGILFPEVLFFMSSGLQLHFSLHMSCVLLFKGNQTNPPCNCVFSVSLSSCEKNGRNSRGIIVWKLKGKVALIRNDCGIIQLPKENRWMHSLVCDY